MLYPDRDTMISEITQQLNGDTDVLADNWQSGSTQEIQELYSILVGETQ